MSGNYFRLPGEEQSIPPYTWLGSQVDREAFNYYYKPIVDLAAQVVAPAVEGALGYWSGSGWIAFRGPLLRGYRDGVNTFICNEPRLPAGVTLGKMTEFELSIPAYSEDNEEDGIPDPFALIRGLRFQVMFGNVATLPLHQQQALQFLAEVESAHISGDMRWNSPLPNDPRELARAANGEVIVSSLKFIQKLEAFRDKTINEISEDFQSKARQLIRALATYRILEREPYTNDPLQLILLLKRDRSLSIAQKAALDYLVSISGRVPSGDQIQQLIDMKYTLAKIADDLDISSLQEW